MNVVVSQEIDLQNNPTVLTGIQNISWKLIFKLVKNILKISYDF